MTSRVSRVMRCLQDHASYFLETSRTPLRHLRTWLVFLSILLLLMIIWLGKRYTLYTITAESDIVRLRVESNELQFFAYVLDTSATDSSCRTVENDSASGPNSTITIDVGTNVVFEAQGGTIRLTAGKASPSAASGNVGNVNSSPVASGDIITICATKDHPLIAFSGSVVIGGAATRNVSTILRSGSVRMAQSTDPFYSGSAIRYEAEEIALDAGDQVFVGSATDSNVGAQQAPSAPTTSGGKNGSTGTPVATADSPTLNEIDQANLVHGLIYFTSDDGHYQQNVVAHTQASDGVRVHRHGSAYTMKPSLLARFEAEPVLTVLLLIMGLGGQLLSVLPERDVDRRSSDDDDV